ncbi:cadherin-like beta sandwich domain-containing protein, partial [Tumebacillus flagellatus]
MTFVLLFVSSGVGNFAKSAHAASSWTPRNSHTGGAFGGVAYGNGIFVAGDDSPNVVVSSDHGQTWTATDMSADTYALLTPLYAGGKWVFSSFGGKMFYSEDNAASWHGVSVPNLTPSDSLWGVAYGVISGNPKYIAVGDNASIATSSDGKVWSGTHKSGASNFRSVVYGSDQIGNPQFVAVGDSANIWISHDGSTWNKQSPPGNSNETINMIAYAVVDGLPTYVIATSSGIYQSADGVSWAPRLSNAIALYGVSYAGNQFIAVGDGGTVVTSRDGVTWSDPENANTSNTLYAVAGDANNRYVAVGDGGTLATKDYSKDSKLTALALDQGYSVSPAFASGTTGYSVSVGSGVSSLKVTPTVSDRAAKVQINGTDVPMYSGFVSVPLNPGSNTITVTVTAQDGITQTVYTIDATRASAAPSTDATLSNLSLSQGTLTPGFAAGTPTYTASVPYTTTSLTVTPTANESHATVKVNNASVASGTASSAIPLSVGPNPITVDVTAQDGTTTKSYTVTVTRAAASTNALLSNLTTSQGSLSPTFSSGTHEYSVDVANSVSSLTVTPTVMDSTATVKVDGTTVASGSASASISLPVGSKEITVLVTAQDGTTQESYSLTVNRAASSNADLSNLTISSGTLDPVFAAGTPSYTVNVAHDVTDVTVTPTVYDPDATVTV